MFLSYIKAITFQILQKREICEHLSKFKQRKLIIFVYKNLKVILIKFQNPTITPSSLIKENTLRIKIFQIL